MTPRSKLDPFLQLDEHLPACAQKRRRIARWAGAGLALCLVALPLGPALAAGMLSIPKSPVTWGLLLAGHLVMCAFLLCAAALGVVIESTRPLHAEAANELVRIRVFNPRVRHALDRWQAVGRTVSYRDFWLIRDALRQSRQRIIQTL
jgi:hypothetical protein